MNNIATAQNLAPQIKLIRARQRMYRVATRWMILQIVLTVILPVIGALLILPWPGLRPYVAFLSLSAVILDALSLDRQHRQLLKRAAKVAEEFDCKILELPWDQFTAGDKVDPEDIHTAAERYSKQADDPRVRDWYPPAVSQPPLHLARIICQRTNLRYDSKLRRSYAVFIVAAGLLLLFSLLVVGLVQNLPTTDLVLTLMPAAPILTWAAREYYRQRDTAEALEELKTKVERLWNEAREGQCDAGTCAQRSREFQNAIYNRRYSSPLVMPFLYRFKRARLESEMNEGAAALIAQLHS